MKRLWTGYRLSLDQSNGRCLPLLNPLLRQFNKWSNFLGLCWMECALLERREVGDRPGESTRSDGELGRSSLRVARPRKLSREGESWATVIHSSPATLTLTLKGQESNKQQALLNNREHAPIIRSKSQLHLYDKQTPGGRIRTCCRLLTLLPITPFALSIERPSRSPY